MTPSLTLWSPPPEKPALADGQVHLWRFRLDLPSGTIAELKQLLSDDELLRSERLLDRLKMNSFIVARGRLRQVLSRYLELKPEGLAFSYGEQGKPSLAIGIDSHLEFNLSHAGLWGLVAVTSGLEIGVDIEQINPQLDFEKIADGFFSATEIERLRQASLARRLRSFYRIWTRKEAWLKAEGSGFSSPRTTHQRTRWLIRSFAFDRNYLGAIAVNDKVSLVRRWNGVWEC